MITVDEPQVSCRRCDWRGTRSELAVHAEQTKHRLCVVCAKSLTVHEKQTCQPCIGRCRADLADILEAYAFLPEVIRASAWRGNISVDALAFYADGSVTGGGPDDWIKDPTPVIAVLESNERDWRHSFGQPPAVSMATVAGCAAYLQLHLDQAARELPQFDDYAVEIRELRSRLMHTAGLANDPQRAQANCFDCGGTLICEYTAPTMSHEQRVDHAARILARAIKARELTQANAAINGQPAPANLTIMERRQIVTAAVLGHNHEGLHVADDADDRVWRCSKCHREYDDVAYRLTVRAATEGKDGWFTVDVVAAQIGKSVDAVWNWIRAMKVTSSCDTTTKRVTVRLSECRLMALSKGQRVNAA